MANYLIMEFDVEGVNMSDEEILNDAYAYLFVGEHTIFHSDIYFA